MIPISYEKQIEAGISEYTIDYIVDNIIDTTKLERKYKNDETGAKAYSPKVLLKIVFLAYSRGIVSSRKIQRLCEENIIFMSMTG